MTYSVIWAPEAHDQLMELTIYIATAASMEVAERYARSWFSTAIRSIPFRIAAISAMTFGLACALPPTEETPSSAFR